jgi:hypothetical protein
LLSDLIAMLKKSGAKYTILYASQPSGLLESPSNLPLGRILAEKNNTTKAGLGMTESAKSNQLFWREFTCTLFHS